MKLSRESQYALLGIVYLAQQPGGTVLQVGEVADATGLTRPFLAKICGRLGRAGLLQSYRGRQRGYALAKPAGEISLRMVVEAIEGPDILRRCVFWSDTCSESQPCLLHRRWQTIRPVVIDFMEHTTIEDLALGREIPGVLRTAIEPSVRHDGRGCEQSR